MYFLIAVYVFQELSILCVSVYVFTATLSHPTSLFNHTDGWQKVH